MKLGADGRGEGGTGDFTGCSTSLRRTRDRGLMAIAGMLCQRVDREGLPDAVLTRRPSVSSGDGRTAQLAHGSGPAKTACGGLPVGR